MTDQFVMAGLMRGWIEVQQRNGVVWFALDGCTYQWVMPDAPRRDRVVPFTALGFPG